MDKTVHTTVFTLKNVSFIIKDGFTLYDNGKAAKESMGLQTQYFAEIMSVILTPGTSGAMS